MHITFFSYLKLLRWHASEDTPNATTPWGTQEDDGDRQMRGTMKKTGCSMFVFIYFYLIFLNNFVTSYKNGTRTNSHDHQHLTPLQHRAFTLSKFFFCLISFYLYNTQVVNDVSPPLSLANAMWGGFLCLFLFLGQPLHWIKTIAYHHHHHHWTTNFG